MTLDVKRIWAEVKANQKRLSECEAPHIFEPKEKTDSYLSKFVCKKCGGEVGSSEFAWYEKGLEHGKMV